ncbi:MAG: ABC transporter ATP-binding protein [Pseudomonadota bacterium]
MASSIDTQDLVKAYPRRHRHETPPLAADHINLSIRAGEFVSLLGSSGCGKTTTLRMIAGLETPTSGRILEDARDITDTAPEERDMRMVFQDYALFPNLTVAQNVAFGLTLRRARRRFPGSEVKRRVGQFLEIVRMEGFADRKPHQLSGGQRQRVALARALVTEPAVVLFDEPLGALDAGLRRDMQFELKRLHSEFGTTFIYVTHDQEEALGMSDRIAVMRAGRVEQIGTPEEVYNAPVNRYVGAFMGKTNILTGSVLGPQKGHLQVRLASGADLAGTAAAAVSPGAEVGVMVRADRLAPVPDSAADSALQAKVRERLFVGAQIEYLLALPNGESLVMNRPAGEPLLETGQQVALTIGPADVRILTS